MKHILSILASVGALLLASCSDSMLDDSQLGNASATRSTQATLNMELMQFNIKSARPIEPSGHAWDDRKAAVAAYINAEAPDIVAVQEDYDGWTMNQFDELAALLSSYTGYVAYRGTTTLWDNEGCGIFYKTSRFTEVNKGRFWLSATYDTESVGWGGEYKRIATWIILRENSSLKEFFVISTHFETWSQGDDDASNDGNCQYESTKIINGRIAGLAEGRTVVLMGDLNSNPSLTPARMLQTAAEGGTLVDTRNIANSISGMSYTTNNWDTADNTGAQFDYVMVTKNSASVNTHHTATPLYNSVVMSDHNPVVVNLDFNL